MNSEKVSSVAAQQICNLLIYYTSVCQRCAPAFATQAPLYTTSTIILVIVVVAAVAIVVPQVPFVCFLLLLCTLFFIAIAVTVHAVAVVVVVVAYYKRVYARLTNQNQLLSQPPTKQHAHTHTHTYAYTHSNSSSNTQHNSLSLDAKDSRMSLHSYARLIIITVIVHSCWCRVWAYVLLFSP